MSAAGPNRAAKESYRDDWETPPEFMEYVQRDFRITLDGAASLATAKAPRWYSEEKDAFFQVPSGETIWLNPPYGQGIVRWIELAVSWSAKNTVLLLVPNSTETEWFQALTPRANETRLLSPRIQFIHGPGCRCSACQKGQKGSNPSGSALAVLSPLGPRGYIVTRRWKL